MSAAMTRSFKDIETAPLPWAMPIPIDYGSVGARHGDDGEISNTVRSALERILTLPALPMKLETAVSSIDVPRGWAETANLAGWMECFGRSTFSDTKARASVQTMYAVASVKAFKAWREKERDSGSTQSARITGLLDLTFAPRSVDFCDLVGSMALLTRVSAASQFDLDIFGTLGTLLLPDVGALAGYDRYCIPNWDGDQAEPILQETVEATRSLLHVLPSNFGEPDIAPAADGTIGLEWIPDTGPLRKLFIDVGPKTIWRAYWKFANGEYGHAHGLTSDSDISDTMKTLFRDLSK